MDLSFDRPGDYQYVRRVDERRITVNENAYERSFLLAPDRVEENWPVTDAKQLAAADIEPILAMQPELVLLGTGTRQVFPPATFMAGLLQRGVGIEVMDNAAAARTYDLLAGEGRRVVVAFILPPP